MITWPIGVPLPASVQGRLDPCCAGTVGFYVQDERYAAGAGMRMSVHSQAGCPDSQAEAEPDPIPWRVCAQLQAPRQDSATQGAGQGGQ